MLDPIGGFERIRDFFISYIETSFRISDKLVTEERRKLLETTKVFTTSAFVEPVLRYQPSPMRLEQMVGASSGPISSLSPKAQVAFAELALSGLFEGDPSEGALRRKSRYAPYLHQVQMLERGIQPGKPGIVTSGTGSGKTESFMLPIMAAISNEAVEWVRPDADYLTNPWWEVDNQAWQPQRAGENRPAALRAMVLYPMNALVEDQMVRLRRTLDSDDARKVMDERFNGNRIFFGQYTSSTPVTGHETHPRPTKAKTADRKRNQNNLRRALQKASDNQKAARDHDRDEQRSAESEGRTSPELTRYIFPSLDGGEMLSRWDMQKDPPDLLITNSSMLGTMLAREVEEPIFAKTRSWLINNDDAYFYLVFDELHLIRGSAGTEVSLLVKSLLQRLGLTDPAHRHKLRILASSASLPMDGELGVQSRRYLRDLFAPFGTSADADDFGSTDVDFWQSCIVEGKPEIPDWPGNHIQSQPFIDLFQALCLDESGFVSHISSSEALTKAVALVAEALGVAEQDGSQLVAIADRAAAALTYACKNGKATRATSLEDIGQRLFPQCLEAKQAVRGLMLARALVDSGISTTRALASTPSFRVHTFLRNVEGLFGAPILGEDGKVHYTDLSTERGLSHAEPKAGKIRGRRLFEMLYCEACGELLIGGLRGQPVGTKRSTELLPSTAELENLPERAAAEYYDHMSFEQFAVFWPSRANAEKGEKQWDGWEQAHLDPISGVVTVDREIPAGTIGGQLYFQSGGSPKGKLTAQPFCCPKCGTDYSNRPENSRSRSPIRAFRTGVSKASQLVATEIFELLHAIGADPKSIVFSDSRQDAANQALEIERLHLRDLRREILVTVARDCLEKARLGRLDSDTAYAQAMALAQQGDKVGAMSIFGKLTVQMDDPHVSLDNMKIRVARLFNYSGDDGGVGALVAEYVRLGIHPFDELGQKSFESRPWYESFQTKEGTIHYANWLSDLQQKELGVKIQKSLEELADDVIFANTFFALEETGLAYPSIDRGGGKVIERLDAWLRVFASATRVKENKYFNDNQQTEWENSRKISLRSRVRRFADGIFGAQADTEIDDVLAEFSKRGHLNGILSLSKIFLRIAKQGDPYWRCLNCERIHLHQGVGKCTRCYERLPESATGVVDELWQQNFLGKRIARGQQDNVPSFRLRCEELTGQTDDFSSRLRSFKNIFVNENNEIARRAREIDLLSATTTMEVGIDIGSLQTVYQANMPPQRFNYQQRVGRAGRRGQAFSFAVTFCRGRTHDAYYYAHPEAITGDAPPPPFLAAGHDPIPTRLVTKVWLNAAFKIVRENYVRKGADYPGDQLVPPDSHGEYVSTHSYYNDPEKAGWSGRLREALVDTVGLRDSFLGAACIDVEQRERIRAKLTIDYLIGEIEKLRDDAPPREQGLAQFLAERGLLPMYGMPTRVRQLYLGIRADDSGGYSDYSWSTLDRDLDTAIFEFAPGSVLTKDKQQHLAIGFTGHLASPAGHGANLTVKGLSNWIDSEHHVALCQACGSAKYNQDRPDSSFSCDDCDAEIPADCFTNYITPAAFRTEYRPTEVDNVGRMAVRTVATVLKDGDPVAVGPLCVRRGASVTIMQLNDGVEDSSDTPLRFTTQEVEDKRVFAPRHKGAVAMSASQAIAIENLKPTDRWTADATTQRTFGLIAKRETDAVYLELLDFDKRLTLDRVARKGENSHLPTRAAAISATQILVQKAALDLDVSSDEFEALEPRLRLGHPMLQIADALINGSGLSRRLAEDRSDGTPHIVHLINQVLGNQDMWPLIDFLRVDEEGHHAARCQTSCYRCIQRYGNRFYHGLLDWRLGLAYLRAMLDPTYSAGLDSKDRAYPETENWHARSFALAQSVENMRPGSLLAEINPPTGLPSLREKKAGGLTYLIINPLWRTDGKYGAELSCGEKVKFIDTFNLERRPLRALEATAAQTLNCGFCI